MKWGTKTLDIVVAITTLGGVLRITKGKLIGSGLLLPSPQTNDNYYYVIQKLRKLYNAI